MNQQVRLGAIYLLGGEFLVSILAAIVRYLSDELSTDQIIFFRNFMGLLALTPLLLTMPKGTLRTDNIKGHVLRGLIGVSSMYCYFWALAHMPLAEAFLVTLSSPLFMPIFAWLWLKEPASRYNLLALLVGFLGVAVILLPNVFGVAHDWPLYALAVALLGAMLMALSKIAIRSMAATENSQRIVFYFAIISSLLTLPLALSNWHPVPAHLWGWLVLAGVIASAGQLATTKGYRIAPTGAIGVYAYSSILYGALLGWLFWNEIPLWSTWAGAMLIIGAGVINLRFSK